MKQSKHKTRVAALVSAIAGSVAGAAGDPWLVQAARDARAAPARTLQALDGYLHALERTGAVSADLVQQWRNEAQDCLSPAVSPSTAAFPVLWSVLMTLATLAWQSTQTGPALVMVGLLLFGVTGVAWARQAGWLGGRSASLRARRVRAGFAAAAAACAVGAILPGLIGGLAKQAAYQVFVHQQHSFTRDRAGLPWIRQFAKENFGADVVLAAPAEAWIRTGLALEGGSPAYMTDASGVCELMFSRDALLTHSGPPPGHDVQLWVQGVNIHELGHCIDHRRDFAGAGGAWSDVRSIAPADRDDVRDAASYHRVATGRASTALWREALADIMMVGYWRLNAPPATARAYIAALAEKRQRKRTTDPTHATMAWIDAAACAAPPASNLELFRWADSLRSVPSSGAARPRPIEPAEE